MSGTTLREYQAARDEAYAAYRAWTVACLKEHRAELAYLEAGGDCLWLSTADRIASLRREVEEWSRVLEKGEPAEKVWPEFARGEDAKP